ncbi:hypothetical protein [uncultured Sphaerochaeta sp.]|uniref:hypothetical protein n=1 Tax=uncultured Sphaerochaeta sp. TaxID=886478 RepID=UPI002A0A3C70|nr:hypothetical protein [uncultured Sphaerochaeta sp.]
MSTKGSVFQKGGGGTNFEQLVQTAFITTLIIRGNVPCIDSAVLSEVALQVTNRGFETDDFMAIAKTTNGEHRLLIQAKHDISFTAKNKTFKEVINAFWKDYKNTSIFDKSRDKLIIAKNGLTKDERNHLKSLFNWAKYHATETDFITEVNRIKGKKDCLDVFREVLKEANNKTALTDQELWEFLKCVDVLEYDFLNEGSVDKTYFLNLIKLSKSKSSKTTEKEIWDSIFAYVATINPNGGSVTLESIKDKDFFKNFDNTLLSPYFKAIEKLKSDSKEILRPIKTCIGIGDSQLQIPRTEVKEKILNGLSNSQITIVTGMPGIGKSAEIKNVLLKDLSTASVFVFRADQFNESTLAKVFSGQGVNETIQDILACISLIPEKIIFIDSLEKLLEADPECAFKQFLALLKEHPEIKFIASSRKYAVDLITLKFGIDKDNIDIINIQTLGEEELKLVVDKFPQLNRVIKNDKVKKLLQSPKYLDFSILAIRKTNEDYAEISLTQFKDELWNSLVVDSTNTKNGLPIKREKAFMEIAVKRAKEMRLFTKLKMSDAEAVACLENDEIVFQNNNNREYSPTHDILEDWALVKYVSSKFDDFSKPKDFFSNLETEPAIRRAFRLWVEDYLIDNSEKVNELIEAIITDQTIEKYWADELLVAAFKSDNCSSIFTFFEEELLAKNAVFFNKCLHIIKTCAKESDQVTGNMTLLLPIGSGWKEAVLFIQKHIHKLDAIRLSILNFLTDWYGRLIFQYSDIENTELEAAKSIVIYYLKQIEEENEFWQERNINNKSKDLIVLLFDLADISKEEIKQLIARAFANIENRKSWKLNAFYTAVIEGCLSGVGSQRIVKVLPELVIEIFWKYWKYVPPEEDDSLTDIFGMSVTHSLHEAECWGININHSAYPSGIYKTPAYTLLRFHPIIGLKLIIDFLNYSVEFYVKNSCEHKHDISRLKIELNEGTVVEEWAAWELWAAYRGMSVTNYVLESLLMSLEKFLLEIAKKQTDLSRKNLKFIFDYILKNSNNVAPLAVLTSVAIAYPREVEEAILPLLTVREFYEWDLHRALQENSVLSPRDNDIPLAQEERWESNQLKHRKQYSRGLLDFIVNYQFNNGNLNNQIFNIFDKLRANINENDILWKKQLNEIDIRNWEVKAYDETESRFVIQPKYEKEVVEYIDSQKEDIVAINTSASYSSLISKAQKNEEGMSYEKWVECYTYYFNPKNLDFLYGRPVTLAVLGLDVFSNSISDIQKEWCLDTIVSSIMAILKDTFTRNYEINKSYSLLEKELALSSFHLLMQNSGDEEDNKEILVMIIYMLFAPFANHDIVTNTKYIREIFFKKYPKEAKSIWLALIKYSNFKKNIPQFYRNQDETVLKEAQEKEYEFVDQILSNDDLKLDISEINLENCVGDLLARAFVITPYYTEDSDYWEFINHLLPIVLCDLTKEKDYSYNMIKESRQFSDELILAIEQYLANIFLNANLKFSKPIFTELINSLSSFKQTQLYGRNDLVDFVNSTLNYFVLNLYDNGNLKIDQTQYNQQQSNFWNLWEDLFNLLPIGDKHPLIQILLLDIRYLLWDFNGKPDESAWIVLNGKKDFYKKILLEKGKSNTMSVINVFSTIGGKEFLPDGISWLTEIFKSNISESMSLASVSAERMIKRLFYNDISIIKNNRTLINDYIWILNRMIDLGSSNAYMFRENVITYKKYTV